MHGLVAIIWPLSAIDRRASPPRVQADKGARPQRPTTGDTHSLLVRAESNESSPCQPDQLVLCLHGTTTSLRSGSGEPSTSTKHNSFRFNHMSPSKTWTLYRPCRQGRTLLSIATYIFTWRAPRCALRYPVSSTYGYGDLSLTKPEPDAISEKKAWYKSRLELRAFTTALRTCKCINKGLRLVAFVLRLGYATMASLHSLNMNTVDSVNRLQ